MEERGDRLMEAPAGTQAGSPARKARLIAATAANLAAWHDLMLRALGHSTCYRDGWWLTHERVPQIFFSAIAVRPGAAATTCARGTSAAAWIAICDPWSDAGMGQAGFSIEGQHPWMVRQAQFGVGDAPTPASLDVLAVETADELADFEHASALGFGSPPQPPFTWHAPQVLADPRLRLWRGRLDGRTVATSMSFVEAGVLGVYGVCTLPDARRRGFGTAMTRAALATRGSLPSVLQPSSAAMPLYRRLGYEPFTTFRTWVRPARPATDASRQ